VFFDRLQNLWSGGLPEDLGTIPIKLTENCRNTHRIAEFAHRPIGQPAVLRSASPAGAEVEVHSCGDADDVAKTLRKVVHRLTADGGLKPDQIVVLSAHSLKKSVLKKHRKFGNLSLVPNDKAAGPNDLRFASLHQFKGLESDVVILVDMQANPGEDSMDQIELYVASSRAKHLLIVIEGG
jgi:superfamily I DNA/RNA helicase